jgi:hypothetical protein
MKIKFLPMAVFGALLSVTALEASSVTVQNYSFEDEVLSPGGYTFEVQAWNLYTGTAGTEYYTGTGQFNVANPLAAPAQGNQAIFTHTGGMVYQDVGALLPNTLYTLTVAVGNRKDQGDGLNGGTISLFNGIDPSATLLVVSDPFSAPAGEFRNLQITFQTGDSVSGDLTIAMQQTLGNNTAFDNVRLDAVAVPEPSSWALIISAFLGVALLRKRQGRKA